MFVRDPIPTRFIVVGKEAIARIYTECTIGDDGLRCIFHTIVASQQGRRYEDIPEARYKSEKISSHLGGAQIWAKVVSLRIFCQKCLRLNYIGQKVSAGDK